MLGRSQLQVMADAESVFHKIKVSLAHNAFLQFLWWPGGDISKPIN